MIDGRFDVVGAAGPTHFFEGLTAATLSHGYLFAGPAGVGKKTFALRLAQSLLCVTPKTTLLGYCGTCSGCTRVAGGVHPDLYVSEGQVKIGEREGSGFHAAEEATARDLVRQLSMHSYAGGRRVFVLGDVEFTREAANALLKFFEEPPPGVVLLLTTTAVARLLPTVRSRLVEVTFPLLTEREVATILEREGVEPDVAAHAAGDRRRQRHARARVARRRRHDARCGRDLVFRNARRRERRRRRLGDAADARGRARGREDAHPRLAGASASAAPRCRSWRAIRPNASAGLPQRDPLAIARALGALGDAERIARTNVSPALVADLAKMALVATSAAS